tara:strand:+ start:5756 stop:9472 length:3717 start_codon:yes stop_codon:yes gene_type:complete
MWRCVRVAACLLGLFAPDVQAKDPAATWASSRIIGTPDPPPPYRTEQVFADVTLVSPTEMIRIPGTDRWCVLQLDGTVLSFRDGQQRDTATMMQLKSTQPKTSRSFGIVFHHDYPSTPLCYIAYRLSAKDPNGTRLSRFRVNVSDSPTIDASSETVLATWEAGGHGGGSLHFGPDGYLYVSVGDGQPPNPPDPDDTGQDLSDLESSVLRIDVDQTQDGLPYAIPPDNPFVDIPGARGEIWAYGFRNPWKMSFHPSDGTLWAGDVGWEMMEMVYRVDRGGNYGWSLMEGSQVVKSNADTPLVPITPPVVEHTHLEARSVTGGYFYGSDRLPELADTYIYGDYITGKVWGLRHDGEKMTWHDELADTPYQIICFARDHDDEVFLVSYDGTIHRLVESPPDDSSGDFPRLLSETGLFTSVADQTPATGVLPYEINGHHWADGTVSQQWLALPDDSQLSLVTRLKDENGLNLTQFGVNLGQFSFPHNAVLAKTVSYQADATDPGSMRRLETQVLHRNGDAWNAYNYVWNEDQSDAVLQDNVASDQVLTIRDPRQPEGRRRQTWHHASRDECLLCHIWKSGTVHGFVPEQLDLEQLDLEQLDLEQLDLEQLDLEQLNREQLDLAQLDLTREIDSDGGGKVNQLDRLNELGLFEEAVVAKTKTISPYDNRQSLEDRARSYLQLNCAHCHRRGGGGTAAFVLENNVPLEKMEVLDAMPVQGGFGLNDPRIIAPGDPYRSVLLYRLVKSGRGHMPQFGSNVIDERGVAMIHDWIAAMDAPDRDPVTISKRLRQSISRASRERKDFVNACSEFLSDPTSALALSIACSNGAVGQEHRDSVIEIAAMHSDSQIRELFERFLPEERRVKRLGNSIDIKQLLAIDGDASRGRELFWSSSDVTCKQCHRIGGQGVAVGPDFDDIGLRRTPAELLASLINPSEKVDAKYQTHIVLTADGTVISGVVTKETDQAVHIVDASGKEQIVSLRQIEARKASSTSTMPDRLLSGFTAQQAADLLAYLSAQKKPSKGYAKSHSVPRSTASIRVDGRIDEDAWDAAQATEPFGFTWLDDGDGPRQATTAKLLWDDQCLYVAIECEDTDIQAERTVRDSDVYRDDCVEIFASPEYESPERYFNLEINALGTVLDNYRPDGQQHQQHSRWDPEEIRIATRVDGTVNDSSDRDRGWSVEVSIPFSLFKNAIPQGKPTVGDRWRLNLHRLEENMRLKSQWSPGDRNRSSFHTPEYFGSVKFVE